jgi:type III pantothenate kinase
MNLCLDIGNSKIRAGIFSEGRILSDRVLHYDSRTKPLMAAAFLKKALARRKVDAIGVISVSPPAARLVLEACRELPGIRVRRLNWRDFGLVRVRYRRPEKLGLDRLANASAAFWACGGPVLVVDVGTAVTWDLVDGRGDYLGGAIAPGPGTMARALHRQTAVLPLIEITGAPRPAGGDTGECIRSGIYWGTVGMIRELTVRISEGAGAEPALVFTGGLGGIFSREFPGSLTDERLTLKGIGWAMEKPATKLRTQKER